MGLGCDGFTSTDGMVNVLEELGECDHVEHVSSVIVARYLESHTVQTARITDAAEFLTM